LQDLWGYQASEGLMEKKKIDTARRGSTTLRSRYFHRLGIGVPPSAATAGQLSPIADNKEDPF